MGNVDQENAASDDSNNMYGMMSTGGDSQTNSSSYPFYVQLETSEGLMLGQHVYIEPVSYTHLDVYKRQIVL